MKPLLVVGRFRKNLLTLSLVTTLMASHSALATVVEQPEFVVNEPIDATTEASQYPEIAESHAMIANEFADHPEKMASITKKIRAPKSNRKLRCTVLGASLFVGLRSGICKSRTAIYSMAALSAGFGLGFHADLVRFKFQQELNFTKIDLSGARTALKFGLGFETGTYYHYRSGQEDKSTVRMFGLGTGVEFTPREGDIIVSFEKIEDRK